MDNPLIERHNAIKPYDRRYINNLKPAKPIFYINPHNPTPSATDADILIQRTNNVPKFRDAVDNRGNVKLTQYLKLKEVVLALAVDDLYSKKKLNAKNIGVTALSIAAGEYADSKYHINYPYLNDEQDSHFMKFLVNIAVDSALNMQLPSADIVIKYAAAHGVTYTMAVATSNKDDTTTAINSKYR